MNSKIRVVIFDLDGTLVDSIPDITAATGRALRSEGFPAIDQDTCRGMVGWGIEELARRVLEHLGQPSDNEVQHRLSERIASEYRSQPFYRTVVYDGIRELLVLLREQGVQKAICTNKDSVIAREVVYRAFGPDEFPVIRGQETGRPAKPDPSTVRDCLNFFECEPHEAVFVGDSDIDVQTARASGTHLLAAGWGFRDRAHLEAAGAEEIFESPYELLQHFRTDHHVATSTT